MHAIKFSYFLLLACHMSIRLFNQPQEAEDAGVGVGGWGDVFHHDVNHCDKRWQILGPQEHTDEVLTDFRGEEITPPGGKGALYEGGGQPEEGWGERAGREGHSANWWHLSPEPAIFSDVQ